MSAKKAPQVVSTWRTPAWWPTANLRVCARDACSEPVYDELDPDVCLRCGIVRGEHGASPAPGEGTPQ